jgi:glycerol uptake facilitator-like aquaporin
LGWDDPPATNWGAIGWWGVEQITKSNVLPNEGTAMVMMMVMIVMVVQILNDDNGTRRGVCKVVVKMLLMLLSMKGGGGGGREEGRRRRQGMNLVANQLGRSSTIEKHYVCIFKIDLKL